MTTPSTTSAFIKDEDFTFSGDDLKQWFRFDRIIARKSKKLFHKQGPKFWNNSAVEIDAQSVQAVAQDTYDGILKVQGIKDANANWEWDYFWTVQYQGQWRADAIETLKDYVESKCTGKAAKMIAELTEDKWPQLRSLMMRKFAKTTPRMVKTMENEYLAGLPPKSGDHPFPRGLDIELKLFNLEQTRLTLWLICPEEQREDYYYGLDSTLVRIILNHVNSDYMPDLNRVLDLHKLDRRQQGMPVPEDASAENYSDEWLPEYDSIKSCLESTYETLKKDKGC